MPRPTLAAILVALIGCDAVLGIEPLPGAGRATIAYRSEMCDICSSARCDTERRTCERDAACVEAQRCFANCAPNDAPCRSLCEGNMPRSVRGPVFASLDHCMRQSCVEECLGVRGLASLFGDACACLADVCANEELACLTNGDATQPGRCERRLSCITRDGLNPPTAERCLGEGDPETQALRRCWADFSCGSCPIAKEGSYECVGDYRWPGVSSSEVTVAMQLATFDAKRAPIPGVRVTACRADDCASCDAPLRSATTDDAGVARLTLPIGLLGFNGCFELTGATYAPLLLYLSRPITHDTYQPMFMIDELVLPWLVGSLEAQSDPTRGHVAALAIDCIAAAAAGITAEISPIDANVRRGYILSSGIDANAPATGSLGSVLFVNVAAGSELSLVTSRNAERVFFRDGLVVRPGTVTAVLAPPHPRL
jgi:hypothetical protein